jgi:hypothetical protein
MASIHNGIAARAEHRENPHRGVANYRQQIGLRSYRSHTFSLPLHSQGERPS